jgi:hypothetical protein
MTTPPATPHPRHARYELIHALVVGCGLLWA